MNRLVIHSSVLEGRAGGITVQEQRGKLDADIAVPLGEVAAPHVVRNVHRLELLDVDERALSVPEANNDLGHAQQEGLYPVLHELDVELPLVVFVADCGARLELDPVDGVAGVGWFGVPDCVGLLA